VTDSKYDRNAFEMMWWMEATLSMKNWAKLRFLTLGVVVDNLMFAV